MCRARLRSNQWRTTDVVADAQSAFKLFERAGEEELAVEAASLASAHASRLGELSLASELATKCILALDWLPMGSRGSRSPTGLDLLLLVPRLRARRELYTAALAMAEELGIRADWRQLFNVADALLLAARHRRRLGSMARWRCSTARRRWYAASREAPLEVHGALPPTVCWPRCFASSAASTRRSAHSTLRAVRSRMSHRRPARGARVGHGACLRASGRATEAIEARRPRSRSPNRATTITS